MICKIGNMDDYCKYENALPEEMRESIYAQTLMFCENYGADRDVDEDDGGYILYCAPGTKEEEIKAYFDYTDCYPEAGYLHKEVTPPLYSVLYLCNNEFTVNLYIHQQDIPDEIAENLF